MFSVAHVMCVLILRLKPFEELETVSVVVIYAQLMHFFDPHGEHPAVLLRNFECTNRVFKFLVCLYVTLGEQEKCL